MKIRQKEDRVKKQRVRKREKREKSRKFYFLIVALAIIIVGSLIGWILLAKGEVSFEEAIQKPELRDGYIEKIVAEIGKPDYVQEINYVDTPEEFEFLKRVHDYIQEPKTWMATHSMEELPIEQLGKQPLPVRISVFPAAFDEGVIGTENDFLSSLFHEYHHAEVLNRGKINSIDFKEFLIIEGRFKGSWNLSLIKEIMEVAAIREEIHSPIKISFIYKSQRFNQYLEHYTNIWSYEEGMNPEFIKSLKIDLFENWTLERPELIKERQKGGEIWYLKHPETGREYYLPAEIVERFSQSGKG